MFGKSILSISNVERYFLNVPIQCHVETPVDRADGLVLLQEGIFSFSLLFLLIKKNILDMHISTPALFQSSTNNIFKWCYKHISNCISALNAGTII